ncbi:LOW QUALITY PROTEIN: dystonin [Balaenoptera acutorostrata]|uniref:LOW QUALITY PROTEIN: dystonin n=1 Tax=Balaenoptera acutorostrata TaxID=9767 RepID=A0ABM3U6U9_BALAC|nr:LOW QUALITY PROTEIN: dystonin [Balaenoptera acutorostrata]
MCPFPLVASARHHRHHHLLLLLAPQAPEGEASDEIVFSGRSRSRDAVLRSHHFRSEGFRASPRHLRRRAAAAAAARLEEAKPAVEVHHQSEQEISVRKRRIKKSSRVQPEFYHSVQGASTRRPSSGNASYRCSMSSSADFSDEDDFSQKSGSASPAPGDTLPWNLPKHERSKRKIHGGSVLDPAERAVLRIADERDKVQKKTFTKWINQHLMKVRKHVNDLYEDLRDGHNLISLLEVLSGDTLPREKGRMRFHRLQNVQIALDYLKRRQVKLVNIRNDDITDGNPKLTLGLIWTIILHFQISDIHVTGESEDMSAKERLLLWTQQATEGYVGIRCENFTTCWRDGKLFNAIIHKYRPDLIDMNTVAVQSNLANLEHAFYVAEKIGVIRLLDPEDVDVSSPDEKSVITYVSSLYDAFPKVPEGGEGIGANDVEVKWIEYQNMVNYLVQWIRHHVTTMSERTFPNNPVELKALYNQYLQFKETEIPPKETEKSKIKRLYKLLEIWIEFGRIKLLQGYHPNDIEKEWGKLIIAMLEREKALRPEVERLDMLQQIASRVQRGSVICEDKLMLARNALQSDSKRLESGVQFQNEAEIAGYVLECENLLRQHVIDVQILIDGKYYQADQLVQRVAKLRDDILALRNECSSVYSKGRVLTAEQTKLMISGITQSLNSGFAQTLNASLNSGLTQGLTPSLTPSSVTSGLSSGLTSRLTPSVTPAYTPGFPSGLAPNFSSGVETNSLQTLKLMQIRKPLLKSSLLDQNLTEEEINMKFVQDLLNWVDEMQVQLDRTEWGSDLPSVESHLENHKNVHQAVEEFESSLKEAKISEIQMTAPLKLTYAEKLHRLENQYAKLLNTSRNQERHLDTLHNFVTRATNELIWLNEKEEEEVAYDWSERNTNIARKKDYHAELMRELDQKEENIKSVQEIAEQLLLENHPARLTIEAYRAAMQTQWSWILQLCQCVEKHIKENSAYFEFFSDAKEATDYLRNLKDAIQRKYSCDRSSSIHKLEDLVQESMEEKEELLQYKSTVASLMGRAKTIIQLKPRNPDCPLKTSIPIKAICDYRQIEITIFKDDECILANNSHRAKWKVISPTGNEAMVPSVCFSVPPPNKEAVDFANRIEQQYQNVLTLWHESHINMKSVVSWHYLINEIDRIRASNVASIKTMLPGEHQQVLSNLQSRFEDFLEDSQESQIFSGSDITQLEKEVNVCKQYYQELLKSAEREEQEESAYNLYISEVRNLRLRLESCEDRLIRQIRTPLERDDLHESVFRISEQEKLKKELERLKGDLATITSKCDDFFSQAAASSTAPTLRSELSVVVQSMNHVYSMSSTYIEKLKVVNLVLKNTHAAEALVKFYETKLCEEEAVTADKNNIENLMSTLKQWRSEVDEKREVFHALEDELQRAKTISDEMFKTYKERDLDFDWHKEKADQLVERWQNVHAQIDNRLRDLEGIGKSLKYYRDTYHPLDDWIQQVETTQRKIQENQPENSKTLATQLNQQKMLVSEIEMKQSKMDECQKYAEQYSTAVKDYELQTMTYRAMVDSQQKSPVKRRRMQSSADLVIQEFMDLRTRYTALVTLMTQYIKFAGDSLKRLEEEEKSLEEEKKEHVEKAKELQKWVSNISKTLKDGEKAEKSSFFKQKISSEEISVKKEQLSEALQTMQLFLAKHGDKMTDEERNELEKQVKTLQESYNLFFSESLKQLQQSQTLGDIKVEEKLDKVIAGTIDQGTGEVLSVFQAVLRGLIDYDTGIRLLETQLMISGLVSPELRTCFDLKDAQNHGLIDEQVLSQLQELSETKEIISAVSSTTVPVLDALAEGVISEPMAIRVLEILLSTGSLVIPATGEQLTLQKAFQQHLVSSALFSKILERQNLCKDLIDPSTSEKVSLIDIMQRSILQENTGVRLLPVRPQEGGRITLKCGRNLSILRAAHEGLIDRETMFRLLGAQLLSGGLINSKSGQRLTVEEAVAEGVMDRDTANSIFTYQVETGGIIQCNPAKRLTVDEAVQCDLITSSSALLVLEAQRGYVGLIWPHSGEIFPTSSSLQQELITNELASKILNGRQKIAALYIPETSQVIGLDVAAQLGIIDNHTASILKNVTLPDKMPDLGDFEACKNSRRWLSFCKFQPSVVHDYGQEEDVFDGEEPVETQSSEHTKKLFLSYLMINSYMDANTGQRLLLYDGDLNDAVGMLLEGCGAEIDENTPVKECLDVIRLPGVFLNNAASKETSESTATPSSFDKCHCREPKRKGTSENAIDEEFQELGTNVTRSEFCQSENVADRLATDYKVKNSSSLCVPSLISHLTEPGLAEVSLLRQDSENRLENGENQSQLETKEHADECSHSKNLQNFASDLISPIVKSKTSRICDLNETVNEDNISRDSSLFDYSPRLSALLSHDKRRTGQGSFHDVHTAENNGNKCEASTLPFNDQTMLSGQRIREKFQDQFLGIAAINISLQGEHTVQKSFSIGYSNPQVQDQNDEKMLAASHQEPEDEQIESTVEGSSCAMPLRGGGHHINMAHIHTPSFEETVSASAGDYETSLLDDQQSNTETDTDSDADLYDMPLFEDGDHDSLLLEGGDHDCLQPEDYDTLPEEDDWAAPPGEAFYDVSKEDEHSLGTQGGLVDSLGVRGEAQSLQDFLIVAEKAEFDAGERIHLNSLASYEVNGRLMEIVSERDSTDDLEGDESDSLTDHEIVGRKGSFRTPLNPEDAGCWRGRGEYVTGQEFKSDPDHLDSVQNEESYGDSECDSNDQGDDDDDGGGDAKEEGAGGEDGKPVCQDEAEDVDVPVCVTTASKPGNSHVSQSSNKTILPDQKHHHSSLEKQQSVNVLQPESSSKSSLVPERSDLPEYTTEVVRKSKDLLNHEMVLKDKLLSVMKDTESENTLSPVGVLPNTSVSSTSELAGDLKNTGVKLIQGPEYMDSVKGGNPYYENVTLQGDSSSDKDICSEPSLIVKPAEESHLSSRVSVTDKDPQGNGKDLIKRRADENNILIEDETLVHKMCAGKGEVLIEGPVEDNKCLRLLPSKSSRECLDLVNSPFPFPQITHSEEHNQEGSLKKATVALKDEPKNRPTIVSKSPVQFENHEEIFDSSVSQVITDDMTSDMTLSERNTRIEKDSFTDGPEKELDLCTYLKHCAKNVKAKDMLKPNEDTPSCILVASPPRNEHMQLGVNNAKEKAALAQEDLPPKEMVQQKALPTKESVSEGGSEIPEFTPERDESTPSVFPLRDAEGLGEHTDFVQSELCADAIRNNSSNALNTDCSSLEINSEKGVIEQQARREPASSPGVQENEVQIPELSQVLIEDVKDILKGRLKEGHMNPQELGEPSACADTNISIQNLIKRVNSSPLVNEASGVSGNSKTSDYGISPMNNSPELKAEGREDPLCTANLKSELLLDILKQNQYSQKITGAFQLMKELTQMECDLEKRGRTSEVLPLQLENVFCKLLADGYSEKGGQDGELNQKSSTASEMMDEKPHILDDLNSKRENPHSLNLQNMKENGSENSPFCASASPRDGRLEELCAESPNLLECISGSKDMASGDGLMEQFSNELQQCLQHRSKMCEYLALLQDMRPPLGNQKSLDNNLEALKNQLKQLETFELGLAPIGVILRKDMTLAEEFLKSLPGDFPRGHLEDLSVSLQSLQTAFSSLHALSSERMNHIMLAIDSEMSKLAVSHEEFLHKLQLFSRWISETSTSVKDVEVVMVQDTGHIKQSLEFLKNVLKDLGHTKTQLETTAFDVQFFISEHAQDLSPAQSRQLLRLLNTTQKGFLDVQESVTTQVEHLEAQLQLEQDLDRQKMVEERQQEYREKLQGICDLLTQTENRLIGHQEAFMIGDGTAELKKYQSKQEELQKDMQGSAQALAEIVKNTENFLKESGEKLSREDKALIEQKLNEAKMKCEQLNLKAEQSKKELDKVVTTAIKEETEKVAAVKQLEESKTKIENLLDWLANVDRDSGRAGMEQKQVIEQNGTHFQEGDGKSVMGEEDEVNGNLLDMDVDGHVGTTKENLNQQYQKMKARHAELVAQHQAVLVATQAAQALLEKQGHHLCPEEKEKLQRNVKELKAHYESALAESEKRMRLTHSLQEELEKFDADYGEFEQWLQQSEQELENLEAGADDLGGLAAKLKRQKSFSEDVISHKGDLRYITISGNRVLEAAKSCSRREGGGRAERDHLDTSATHREVQGRLDRATDRFRSLYTKCNVLGNNLKDLVDKYQHYEDASCGLLSGLQACEATASKHLSEPIAVDPKNLQRQLEEMKALQGQISSQQVAVEKLKKTAEVLLDARGSLLPAKNDIQKTLGDIVGRYDDLSKSVSERNEKLQITLTRSLSVQDGLDEMLDWMAGVERSLEEQRPVPLNSAALQDVISKNIMLDQDIAGRQSSINAMNEKVKRFTETTDPSTASSLQARMKDLALRFSEASRKHKEKLAQMEELKTKVELFENLSEKLQTFLETKTQALTEADVPEKDVTELSQFMQESTSELLERRKDLEVLQNLLKEISSHGLPGDKALVFEKTNNLSKKFKEMEDTVKEKKEAVSSCQEQMDAFQVLVKSLKSWIKETTERVPVVQPSFGAEDLGKSLEETKKLQEKWSLKTPEIQKVNNSGISLCNLISAVMTPAKAIAAVKSGGVILNGEGTATDTQDILANKGLTSIKKDMSDISHGYEDLGLLLKDKIAELSTKLSRLQKAQEESSAMMQWLQTMNKTATKWHQAPTPTDTEAVKSQVEQNKSFEAELKQNVNKVQELKDKLTELLEENPDTPEAPKWKQMLTEIDSKWQELNQLTVDRRQKLEESSNNLTQFQTVEAQLKQWLAEKELMVSVLGPLSIDPNMLNTQRQQVQILLQEFDTRKPQCEQLTVAGQGILHRPGEHPSFHGIVKEQLAAVTQKWDSLTGQLRDRCDRIDQAIVKSTQYQSLLRSLSDKLADLDNKLSSSVAGSTHPDAMNQQLETAQKMKQEIEQEMKQIKVAQALGEDLAALVKEEYLKAELSRQLEGILKSFKDLEQKAENHVQHLQSACASSHQFQQMSRDFQAWLDTKKEEQNKSPPISAKVEVLESLMKDQKDFRKTLTAQSHIYEKTMAEGENLLLKTQGSEKVALQLQLNTIKTNWDGFQKQVKEREDRVKESLEKALKYKEHVEMLRPWIDRCQNSLKEIKCSLDPAETEKSLAQLKSLQKERDQHFGMVEQLNSAASSLLSVCEMDKEAVAEEKESLLQKVDMVTEQVHWKKFSLENMAQKFKEFQEVSKEAQRQLQCAKEQLDMHDSLGPQAYSSKSLTVLQTQQKALQTLKPQVDLAQGLAQDLVAGASDSKGTSEILLQAEALAQEHSALSQQVDEKCSFLETKLQGIGHFQNTIREMFSQFAEFDDELDSMAPVGRDVETLQKQREAIKAFLEKLEALIASNTNANKTCKLMLATEEASPDLVGIKRDLEALSKQCNKLRDRAQAREEQVEGTITRLEEFYSKLNEFSTLLQKAEEHEESLGPVGMETEMINQQLDVFKVFQKEEIEPLQVKQQDVNWLGQGLVQSAAKGTSTQALERDLDNASARWKTLNKKVAQRAAQLQEALLHCGRFQDALESLLSWMVDTEELVANQKPPSAEFKVVKAQIQEQKLLQRLLDDRKSTVEVIKREGEKIAATAEPADKVKILKQLSLLDSRWAALLNKAETRNRQLEGISVVAQQFHETLEPLNEWLTTTEKRLANSEPIGTQASKLEEQIAQHKALEDDINHHNKHLHQAVSIGQSLKVLSSREDKDMVQSKLDSSQVWYIEIQEKSHGRSELLQQALCNAKIFGEDEVELMNWLSEVHDKLRRLSVQDSSPEGLWTQQAELRVLQEDILLRKQNVDQALLNGLELLKRTTGDEVLIIQDKLEAIKARYQDITKLSTDVAKTLEQALQLARRLHSTHEGLCAWLDKVEVELLSYETQVLKGEASSQAHARQKELKKETKSSKALLDSLNEVSSALLELVPWRAREGLEKMVAEDNDRYRLVSDTITQKVEEIDAAILRSQQFDQAADAELAWISETDKKLTSLGDIRLEQDQTSAQLQVQKTFTMEILRHKDIIDELVKSGHKIMSTCSEEEKQPMKKKLDKVLKNYDAICQTNSERYLQLERAQSLVNQFWETYEELWPWLIDIQRIITQLPAPALEYETLRQQQEEHRQLRELIAEHKPHIDKMNKTGPQLLELSPREGFSIQEKYVAADTLYSQIKEDVKKRAVALDEAISQSAQFHDKIDQILESLERVVERLRQPPSISAEVEKIKEQVSENKNVAVDMEKLQPLYETLRQRGEEMIARSQGTDKDISAKAVQDKLDQMVFIWENIHTLVEEREAKLLDVMELAEKFWCDHMSLVVTIKDTQDFIRDLEDPGIDPSVVKQQQEAAEVIREEIDGLQEELDMVINLGSELIAACGEPDKPIVKKSIDELNSAWDALNKAWKDRVDRLEEAMQAAVQYQDGLQAIFDWVDIAGGKLASLSPIGTDLETVKQQIGELKQFKSEAYQQQIEMERLNHQAELLLKKVTEESDKHTVLDPLTELKLIWDSLDERIINRQHKLEGALLALGQFQHALDELLAWLTHTEGLLSEQKPVGGDPKAIEIELAKHHVLQNDVLAHQSTVEAVNKAGNDLIESSAGEEASNLQNKLEVLNQRWQNVLEKTEQRKQQLDGALRQAKGFHGEIEDLQQWLTDTERHLLASKPLGGLPETAREQLNAHMEICAAFDVKEETYKSLMQKGQQMLARCPKSAETNIDQDINNLKEKWESVETKLNERKVKLEEALTLAMEFHSSLQDFINWLTQAEQTLNVASRPSLILDTVLFQIDEHKVFANEVNSHREQIIELDKTGTHLKYFSQKQDVVLIKNLLISVQSRWEKVAQRLVERGRSLDDARKRAKQFHEAWSKLMEWLEESEKSLDSELEIANDPDKIKAQLAQHKEFQKSLGAKHSVYDTTNRTGRSLKEKTSLADDNLKLDDMLSELRDKWDTICGKSVERQNKLEEALLFSGQFTDALQALIDWLYRVEPQLAEDQPVHGDIDLVMNLIDNHKVFQKELGKRTSSVQALKRSARELIEGSQDDSSWVRVQMQELSTRWETVCALSISKQTRLEAALRQAEEFHSVVHALLEWLAEAEQTLRFHGVLPDDEDALRTLIDQHKEFMKRLEEKRAALNKATSMGDTILAICHPDSITTIKHWITIIRARFEEVLAWAKQHQQRLASALAGLIAKQELLEALLAWLQWAETTLSDRDKEVIPQEIEEVKALIAEHQTFMEEMTRKQPDVDKVTKTYKRRVADPSLQSHIPVLDKGRAGRKRFPASGFYPSGSQTQIETKNPRVNLLVSKWQQVWLLALERRRKLNDALDRLEELREFANFDFDVWRKKYMRWMNHKKSRVMDFFRRIDKDQDGKITRQEFIDGILSSKFPTSRLEMSAVADIFDRDGDGYIDYYEFVAALHPNKDAYKPITDADKIEDEVTRQVAKCKCAKRFQVEQIGDNKYRFFLGNQFGDSQQLRLVRILRSTVMVRVGGGWMALDEFLVKNDPCRVHHHGSKMLRSESNSSITTTQPTIAKGRTNMELREKFILADGASQGMAAFRPRGRRSRPSSRGASPNRSTSMSSPAGQAASPQVPATSTPKILHPLTRNYGKPWLTNSKVSTPCKPAECSDFPMSSPEGTPIQGSKLRLPGYLSGKGFHSGEDSGLITTAASRVRTQFADPKKTHSRPGSRAGSKAGSRASSRRGSDASDFDISEIQSVCSDVETVPQTHRPTPRADSRPSAAKPSKIPTPQRKSPASKLDKSSKR